MTLEHPISTERATDFVDAVLGFVRDHRIDLVLPTTDWTLLPLSQHRDRFRGLTMLPVAPHEALETASDKYQTILLAEQVGVPAPKTTLVQSMEEVASATEYSFPMVVKDRYSARWIGDRAELGSAFYAYSRDELVRRVRERVAKAGDVLVQSFIGGVGVGFSCFVWKGEVYLPFQWKRIREIDPRGSGSSARMSVDLDSQVLAYSRELIRHAGFQGMAMVEYKKNPESGRLVLMEINGRPWGSLQLPIDCGIDYPLHLVRWALEGKAPPSHVGYKKGVVNRSLVGDLMHLKNVFAGKPPGWPMPYPRFLASLARVCVPWYPGLHYADLSVSDPRPGIVGLWQFFRRYLPWIRWKQRQPSPQLTLKGIVHCHTTTSYDGKVSLSDLCAMLRREGFDFVALSEHAQGLSDEDFAEFVESCRKHSTADFLVIPGLEVRCGTDVEIAAIGVTEVPPPVGPAELAPWVRERGGFAIWVHPFKGGLWSGPFLDCDASEVMNGKLDGTLAPNLSLLRSFRRERRAGKRCFAVFGLDFHDLWQPRQVWVECAVSEKKAGAIVDALRQGRFTNHVPWGTVSSGGRIGLLQWPLFILLRSAYLVWRTILRAIPAGWRSSLISASRPAVRILKRRGP
jgi:predicted ATP-grasp superfamily ATP-dependent carboligase